MEKNYTEAIRMSEPLRQAAINEFYLANQFFKQARDAATRKEWQRCRQIGFAHNEKADELNRQASGIIFSYLNNGKDISNLAREVAEGVKHVIDLHFLFRREVQAYISGFVQEYRKYSKSGHRIWFLAGAGKNTSSGTPSLVRTVKDTLEHPMVNLPHAEGRVGLVSSVLSERPDLVQSLFRSLSSVDPNN